MKVYIYFVLFGYSLVLQNCFGVLTAGNVTVIDVTPPDSKENKNLTKKVKEIFSQKVGENDVLNITREVNQTLDNLSNKTDTISLALQKGNGTVSNTIINNRNSTTISTTTSTITTISSTMATTKSTTSTSTTTTTKAPKTKKPKKPTKTYGLEDFPNLEESVLQNSEKLVASSIGSVPKRLTPEILPDREPPNVQPSLELNAELPYHNNHDYIVPILTVMFTVPLILGILITVYRRFRDCWSTRHYRRMDFLVDGMYND